MDKEVADALIDAEVVKFGLFTLSSGRKSPVYVDIRKLPSYPKPFELISEKLAEMVKGLNADIVAGAETAGIPIAAGIAIKGLIPMVYVRKRPKGYGTNSFVEGNLEKGQVAVLVDDMITDGRSKFVFVEGLKNEGAAVKDVIVILDREQGGKAMLADEGLELHSLITLKELLDYMHKKGKVDEENFKLTLEYLDNPERWNK
ncbi:orotate phosphoribosyltransferase [Candidatus Woesearchaeota archaeon]|nr:orotate phosphoribosyltransferase [Candidatus Woesearchaeota archaeon]